MAKVYTPKNMDIIPPPKAEPPQAPLTETELQEIRQQILAANAQTMVAIFKMGELLSNVKERIKKDKPLGADGKKMTFEGWIASDLPFGLRNAEYYMDIHEHLGFLLEKRNGISPFDEDGHPCFGVFSLNFALDLVRATKRLGESKVISILMESSTKDDDDLRALRKKLLEATSNPPQSTNEQKQLPAPSTEREKPKKLNECSVASIESFPKAFKKVAGKRFAAVIADPRKHKDVKTPQDYRDLYESMKELKEDDGFLAMYVPREKIKDVLPLIDDMVKIGVKAKNPTGFFDEDFELVIMNEDYTPPQNPTSDSIINQYVKDGGQVLDLFCDSANNGAACVRSGRSFVGIEKDAKRVEAAQSRIDEAYNVNPLVARYKAILAKYSENDDEELTELSDKDKAKVLEALYELEHGSNDVTIENVHGYKKVPFSSLDDFYDFFRDNRLSAKPRIDASHLFPDAYVADALQKYFEGDDTMKRAMKSRLAAQAKRAGTETGHKLFNDELFTFAKEALEALK